MGAKEQKTTERAKAKKRRREEENEVRRRTGRRGMRENGQKAKIKRRKENGRGRE
jgi:hypothetical protein